MHTHKIYLHYLINKLRELKYLPKVTHLVREDSNSGSLNPGSTFPAIMLYVLEMQHGEK